MINKDKFPEFVPTPGDEKKIGANLDKAKEILGEDERKMEKILGAEPDLAEINMAEATGFSEYLRKKIKFTEECFSTAQSPEVKVYYLNQERALEDLMKQVIKYSSRQEEYSKLSFGEKLKNKLKSLEEILDDEGLDDEERQIAIHERTRLENYCRELSDFKNKRSNFA